MAALPEAGSFQLVELDRLRAEELEAALEEETELWRQVFDWDFRPSADLVRRFVRMRALSGWALAAAGHVIGYSYFVVEDAKGLIGDLYVRSPFRSGELESRLLEAVLTSLFAGAQVRRVEAQLMLLESPFERPIPYRELWRGYRRYFMAAELAGIGRLPRAASADQIRVEGFRDGMEEAAARLIAAAYKGHIDSQINDQYRSVSGARRFLANIVQYPGCGAFYAPASLVAIDPASRELVGLVLASLVSARAGHITQICTAPEARGRGVGYELLRRSMGELARAGCTKVSLTVTAANGRAVQLYQRAGFEILRSFAAYVWTRG